MKDIAIYGAGGLGREVACMIEKINEKHPTWKLIGFFDDGKTKGEVISKGEILGGMEELNIWDKPLSVVMAIGNPNTLKTLVSKISNPNLQFPNIIAPNVLSFGDISQKLGRGNIICFDCILSCDVRLDNFNILNGQISVGHDSVLGSYNVVMPGTKLSGGLIVGDCNLFGANSFVHQQVKIGNNIRLGACSALLRKPKDGFTYIGNPAVIMKF